ncbi:MAG: UDP-N-acetylmuramoyl-tripeptide--D-alanyl-D-alanine ligase [candidate division WOR-3 bacterium]
MKEITLEKVIKVLKGKYIGNKSLKNRVVSGVSVDSRKIKEKEIFFALKGKNFDGHDFIKEATKKSKLPAVSEKEIKGSEIILVKDSLKSLGDLASYYKKERNVFTIAVTGSIGKTTTKDFIGAVFSTSYPTLISFKNYNNLIGVPLNLFRLEDEKIAVLELGTNKFGEIKRLSEIVEPDLGVITGIGSTHLEAFKNKEGVLREKLDIISGLKGPLFINGDDPLLRKIKMDKLIKVGFSEGNDFVFKIIEESINGTIFSTKDKQFLIKLPSRGLLRCAMFAVSIGLYYGLEKRKIQKGLLKIKNSPHRMEIKITGDYNIIDDTYNSNPDSLLNAIAFLPLMPGRKVVVLGPMLELGEASFSLHKRMGERLKLLINELIVIGEEAKGFLEGFSGGHFAKDKEEALQILKEILRCGDTILFKSSRALKLETLVDKLIKEEKNCSTYSPL